MDGEFLQSQAWQKFQASLDSSPVRVEGVLFARQKLRWGNFFLASRFCLPSKRYRDFFLALEKNFFLATSPSQPLFVRLEPLEKNFWVRSNFVDCLKEGIFSHRLASGVQPSQTAVVFLEKPQKMLEKMHPKTRYNLRLAQRKSLSVKRQKKAGRLLNDFWSLASATARRQGFRYHSFAHYRLMLEKLTALNCQVWVSYLNKTPLSAMITLDDKDTRYYLHGASSDNYKNLMSPYLLHWQALTDARAQGLGYYDFWGVAPLKRLTNGKWHLKNPHHPWAGITRLKLSFAPKTLNYRSYPQPIDLHTGKILYKLYALKYGKAKI